MMNQDVYKRTAAGGCEQAQHVLDEMGAMPEAEMSEADSEAQKVAARAEHIGHLKGKAEAHTGAGEHDKAAAAHEERGRFHEAAGEHQQAMDAYKDALACHKAGDCWGNPAQAAAVHASEADRK